MPSRAPTTTRRCAGSCARSSARSPARTRSPPTTSPCCTHRPAPTPVPCAMSWNERGWSSAAPRSRPSPGRWPGRPCGCCSTPSTRGAIASTCCTSSPSPRSGRPAPVAAGTRPAGVACVARPVWSRPPTGHAPSTSWPRPNGPAASAPRRSTRRTRASPTCPRNATCGTRRRWARWSTSRSAWPPPVPRYGRARTWSEAAAVLADELANHVGSHEWRELHWADAPVWQRRAAEQVATLLAALTQFDQPHTALAFGRATLRRVVEAELDRRVRKAGDASQGVRVLPLQHGICLDARTVYVLGVNDGVLPARRTDDLIVPRELSAECAAVVEHADWHRRRLRRAWDATLHSGAAVVATFARTDLRRGGAVYRSSWLDGADEHEHASHAAGLRSLAPLTAAEAVARRGEPSADASPVLQRRAIALASRMAADAGAFDGWIGAHPEHDPTAAVQAVTRFEGHARCGLSYFIERVLKVDTGTDPSEITEIEAMTKGNLAHRVMERVVGEWLQSDPATRPAWLQGGHLAAMIERVESVLDEEAARLAAGNLLGNPHAWAIERDLLARRVPGRADGRGRCAAHAARGRAVLRVPRQRRRRVRGGRRRPRQRPVLGPHRPRRPGRQRGDRHRFQDLAGGDQALDPPVRRPAGVAPAASAVRQGGRRARRRARRAARSADDRSLRVPPTRHQRHRRRQRRRSPRRSTSSCRTPPVGWPPATSARARPTTSGRRSSHPTVWASATSPPGPACGTPRRCFPDDEPHLPGVDG